MTAHAHPKRSQSGYSQSTVFLDRLSPVSSARRVKLNDDELLKRVQHAQSFVNVRLCPKTTTVKWEKTREKNNCELFARDDNLMTEVLITGDVACTVEEMASIFRTPTESDHNALMKALHGKNFIYGSMVHIVQNNNTVMAHQLAVKTTTFANSMFSKNEEGLYVEYFQPSTVGDGFTVTIRGLEDHEVQAGRAMQDRVELLQNITLELAINQIRGKNAVRLRFYGCYQPPQTALPTDGYVSARKARARLLGSAKAFANLPEIVQRRRERLDTKHLEKSAPNNNTHCPVCTKAFSFFSWKTICQLCAYSVCESCCSLASMETYAGYKESMVMCKRCVECVDREEQSFNK